MTRPFWSKFRQDLSLNENLVTDEALMHNRRKLLKDASRVGLGLATLGAMPQAGAILPNSPLNPRINAEYQPALELTDEVHAITYNNFYEFGTSKKDPYDHGSRLSTEPWKVKVDGLVNKPQTLDVDDLLKAHEQEERIYRFRCVEGWSMVVPWTGFELAALLKKVEPQANAKYVRFETLFDPQQLPFQNTKVLDWPYVEGLRLDEAMHPLTLMATGLYGKALQPQSGAPLRLIVPWKYGFKSIKSIVRITLTAEEPPSTWMKTAPEEYGFYANVNPKVAHRRWSQAKERPLGSFFKQDTLMYNGYEKQVAGLYKDMAGQNHFY